MDHLALENLLNRHSWRRNYDNLTENDRQIMLVDEIFAVSLWRTSQKINEAFYRTVLTYTILFRECLNDLGWSKKIESEGLKLEEEPELK